MGGGGGGGGGSFFLPKLPSEMDGRNTHHHHHHIHIYMDGLIDAYLPIFVVVIINRNAVAESPPRSIAQSAVCTMPTVGAPQLAPHSTTMLGDDDDDC